MTAFVTFVYILAGITIIVGLGVSLWLHFDTKKNILKAWAATKYQSNEWGEENYKIVASAHWR
ncbi:MAG: hypothetical protein V4641_12640 [Pseudomonadota bacterium]